MMFAYEIECAHDIVWSKSAYDRSPGPGTPYYGATHFTLKIGGASIPLLPEVAEAMMLADFNGR